jgi:hypothetical protein
MAGTSRLGTYRHPNTPLTHLPPSRALATRTLALQCWRVGALMAELALAMPSSSHPHVSTKIMFEVPIFFYIMFLKLCLKFSYFRIQIFKTTLDGKANKSKVVDLDEMCNFVIDNFFIRHHLWSQKSIWSCHTLKFKKFK